MPAAACSLVQARKLQMQVIVPLAAAAALAEGHQNKYWCLPCSPGHQQRVDARRPTLLRQDPGAGR